MDVRKLNNKNWLQYHIDKQKTMFRKRFQISKMLIDVIELYATVIQMRGLASYKTRYVLCKKMPVSSQELFGSFFFELFTEISISVIFHLIMLETWTLSRSPKFAMRGTKHTKGNIKLKIDELKISWQNTNNG